MRAILGEGGRGARDKIPVFGILERDGKVKVEVVKDVKAETLLTETIKKVKMTKDNLYKELLRVLSLGVD